MKLIIYQVAILAWGLWGTVAQAEVLRADIWAHADVNGRNYSDLSYGSVVVMDTKHQQNEVIILAQQNRVVDSDSFGIPRDKTSETILGPGVERYVEEQVVAKERETLEAPCLFTPREQDQFFAFDRQIRGLKTMINGRFTEDQAAALWGKASSLKEELHYYAFKSKCLKSLQALGTSYAEYALHALNAQVFAEQKKALEATLAARKIYRTYRFNADQKVR